MIRETSAISHAINDHDSITRQIRDYVRKHGPCTRRQVSVALGIDTATVSGIVTPLVRDNLLDEIDKVHCPITGRLAIQLAAPVVQMRLI